VRRGNPRPENLAERRIRQLAARKELSSQNKKQTSALHCYQSVISLLPHTRRREWGKLVEKSQRSGEEGTGKEKQTIGRRGELVLTIVSHEVSDFSNPGRNGKGELAEPSSRKRGVWTREGKCGENDEANWQSQANHCSRGRTSLRLAKSARNIEMLDKGVVFHSS